MERIKNYYHNAPIDEDSMGYFIEVLYFLLGSLYKDEILDEIEDDDEKEDIIDTVDWWMKDNRINLDLVTFELGEPFELKDFNGNKYFLTWYDKKENSIDIISSKIPFKKLFKNSYFI